MSDLTHAATAVGYAVFAVGGVGLAIVALALTWAFFPIRWQWSRDLPSRLETPSGPLRLTAMAGLSSRRKSRWFFGLMLLREGAASPDVEVSR